MIRNFALAIFVGCHTTSTVHPLPEPSVLDAAPEAAPIPSALVEAAVVEAAVVEAGVVEAGAPAPRPTVSAGKPTPDAARDKKIKQQFGDRCRLERTCGTLWGIDCDAAVDGPYFYVKENTLDVVARCGGFCMSGKCTNCPPREWKCPTY